MFNVERCIQDGVTDRLSGTRAFVERNRDTFMDDGDKISGIIRTFKTDELGSKEFEATLTKVTISFARLR